MTELERVVSWNCKVNRPDDAVGDGLENLIEDLDPDTLCLQEARGYIDMLKNRFGDDWWIYSEGDWEYAKDCPVLVRKKGREKAGSDSWGTVRYTTDWVGPHGKTHPGRTWTWARVDGVLVMSFHRCWDGNGRNKEAFADEDKTVSEWMRKKEGKPILIFGDHNCAPNKTFPHATKLIAQNNKGGIAKDEADPGIDYVLKRGIKGTVHRKKPYGSDHEAMLFKRTED